MDPYYYYWLYYVNVVSLFLPRVFHSLLASAYNPISNIGKMAANSFFRCKHIYSVHIHIYIHGTHTIFTQEMRLHGIASHESIQYLFFSLAVLSLFSYSPFLSFPLFDKSFNISGVCLFVFIIIIKWNPRSNRLSRNKEFSPFNTNSILNE